MMTLPPILFKYLTLLCLLLIYWLSSQSTMPVPLPDLFPGQDKLAHLIMYSGLSVCVGLGFCRRPLPYTCLLLTFSVALLYGITDEWHQSFVPNRTMSGYDLVADALGGIVGGFIAKALVTTRIIR